MSLEHPLALVLLVVPAILLWLRMRADRPRAAEASSLLVWDKVSPSDTVPEKPRPPLAAWIEAAGAALLVLGMAGPMGPEGESSAVTLLTDQSPSMGGRRLQPMLPIDALPRAKVEEWPSLDLERDLPSHLSAGKSVVVVTDHRLPLFPDEPPRLRVVGLGKRGFNAGITVATGTVLSDGRWRILLVVEAHGAAGPVEGTLRMGMIEDSITVGPGKPVELVRDVPSEVSSARILFPGDCMEEDNAVLLRSGGGREVSLVAPDRAELRPLVRALVAAGARRDEARREDGPMFLRSEKDARLDIDFTAPGSEAEVRTIHGRDVTTSDHPLTRDVRIDPGVTMGTRLEMEPVETAPPPEPLGVVAMGSAGTRLLAENGRTLATFYPAERNDSAFVRFRFIPGGTWAERDPSFVVLAKNMVEFVGGGESRVETAGLLDARETREAAEGETFGDLRTAIVEASRPDPAARTPYTFALLMAGGAALAAAWLAMR